MDGVEEDQSPIPSYFALRLVLDADVDVDEAVLRSEQRP